MHPRTRNVFIVVIACGLILGGALYWETAGPSPTCGPCWAANPPGCPIIPCTGHEALSIYASQTNSPSNVTLSITNVGSVSITLDSYNVKDALGNQYTKTNWSGPSLPPNSSGVINIIIDGNAFTFQSKNSYTITLTSTRNNLFTVTITA
jgi:archaellum component FlaG (FlaF/FlaG flagellin family)